MRDAKVKVYTFDELSEEAKERARSDFVEGGGPYYWVKEARDTIKAFENEFGVKVCDWGYSSYTYDYRLDFSAIDDDVLALKGNRARAWFWNNHGDCLLTPRVRYFTHLNGKRIEAVGIDSIKYKSKVDFDRVYDGTCPWTGYCMDCAALDPIAYFCFGVEWDEKEKKRVPSSRRLSVDNSKTVESLLREGIESLFHALKEDCEYIESMESFKETCEANDFEFTEDGRRWRMKEAS